MLLLNTTGTGKICMWGVAISLCSEFVKLKIKDHMAGMGKRNLLHFMSTIEKTIPSVFIANT